MLKPVTPPTLDTTLAHFIDTQLTVSIFLKSGIQLRGKIQAFDPYSILLLRDDCQQQQLIFKHAISTIVTTQKRVGFRADKNLLTVCS